MLLICCFSKLSSELAPRAKDLSYFNMLLQEYAVALLPKTEHVQLEVTCK